nr:hypothetical protein [Tanacetum cinerariifolium]
FIRSGRIPISVAKPNAATSTSVAKQVNTVGPKQSVNFSRTRISAVKGNEVTAVKTSAGCVWRPKVNAIDQISKDNRWICTRVDYVDPQGRLKSKSLKKIGSVLLLLKIGRLTSDDDSVFTPEPIPAKIDFVKAGEYVKHVKPVESIKHVKPVTPVKTTKQTEKSNNLSSSPKVDRKN